MLQGQQRLAGRIAGYHRLARWVALRQPLSLAGPRIARPPALVPLAALRDDLMASPIEDENAQPRQLVVENPSPLQVSPEPEFAAASGTPARSEGPSALPATAPLFVRPTQADRAVARDAAVPQQEGQPAAPVVSTQVASAARDERATAAPLPAEVTASAALAAPRAIPAANDDGGDGLPSITVPVAHAVLRSADDLTGRAAPDDRAPSVDVARSVVSPMHPAPADPSSSLAPLIDDAGVVAPRRAASTDEAVSVAAVPPVREGEDRVLKNEQRRDSRPLVESAITPRSEGEMPTPIVPVDVAVAATPTVTTDKTVTASTVNTGEVAAPVPTVTTDGAAVPTPTVIADESVVPAPPTTTGGTGAIEVVQPRRPRPQSPFPTTRTRANRPQSRETDLPDEVNVTVEALAGQTHTNANPDASASPEAIVNRTASANIAPLPFAAGQSRAALPAADDAEGLFAPRQTDRSPESWVARLTGRATAAQPPPSSPPPLATPEPFSGDATATSPPIAMPGRRTVSATPASPVPRAIAPPPVVDASAVSPAPIAATMSARPLAVPEPASPPPVSAPVAPTPLPDSTRHFLQPLVGIDPASVRIYSDPATIPLVARANADALAVGDVVALGTGWLPGAGTPETLGLLAHELTHVARTREPRFVPPIARAAGLPARAGGEIAAPTDEEALARTVEARVTRAAEAASHAERQSVPLSLATPRRAVLPPIADREPADLAAEASVPTGDAPGPMAASVDTLRVATAWNGLPAPWEPLPNWLATPAPSAYTVPSASAASAPPAPGPTASALATPGAEAPTIQLAEHGRAVDEAAPTGGTSSPEQHAANMPEPDLDALARQVYAVLRRRLAVEGRRAW